MKYSNEFDKAVAERRYYSDWFKERCFIVALFMDVFYDKMTYFIGLQDTFSSSEFISRIFVFELFGNLYVYVEHIEDGKIESGQLEKVYDIDNDISFVLYSNIENAEPATPFVMKLIKSNLLKPIDEMSHLFKGN